MIYKYIFLLIVDEDSMTQFLLGTGQRWTSSPAIPPPISTSNIGAKAKAKHRPGSLMTLAGNALLSQPHWCPFCGRSKTERSERVKQKFQSWLACVRSYLHHLYLVLLPSPQTTVSTFSAVRSRVWQATHTKHLEQWYRERETKGRLGGLKLWRRRRRGLQTNLKRWIQRWFAGFESNIKPADARHKREFQENQVLQPMPRRILLFPQMSSSRLDEAHGHMQPCSNKKEELENLKLP